MARILFSTIPRHGHLDFGGLWETAVQLQQDGHHILWLSGAEVKHSLEARNIPFLQVPVAIQDEVQVADTPHQQSADLASASQLYAQEAGRFMEMWLQPEQAIAALQAHLAIARSWKPDLMVAGPLVVAAHVAARALAIPFVAAGYPGPLMDLIPFPECHTLIQTYYRRMDLLHIEAGLPPLKRRQSPPFFYASELLQLVFFIPEWFTPYPANKAASVRYVGGVAHEPTTAPPPWLAEINEQRPLIVIAQPTGYPGSSRQLASIFHAIEAVGGFGLLGGMADHRRDFASLPDHIRWEAWLPYEHVMPRATAVVHHGGMGTTHDAILHGLPQLVLPQAVDQFMHADGVARHQAGLVVTTDRLNETVLANQLRRLITTPAYRQAAEQLSQKFAALGGVARAATLLANVATAVTA